ncbi:DUF2303 family protein [Ochrobactrum chromiisoli]|uniref:DUF2303 family protein n=1 Tax=Ochrobactrum chromiisoli TaxID=2993941 RepID=A0ABT3QRY6_9HYPH|nr:DUF2303 family protein [Ochrobactrum chromiisoli]MCX2698354.1 DUF2303 family protein [Ochrobactrum chromiisoli]
MSETPIATNAVHNLAIDITAAAELGAQASGAELVTIETTESMIGLPKEVPALLTRGSTPSISGVDHILEKYRVFPSRKRGVAQVQTLDALIDLTNRHKTEDSAIFANLDWTKPSLTSIIDYHRNLSGGDADNCQHRIHYEFPLSDDWKLWVKNDGEVMSQQDFAIFLEDRIPDLASPTEGEIATIERDFNTTVALPSQLVNLSRKMQVNVSSQVKTETKLQSGEGQIQWEETHTGADGQPVKVPGIFILSIAPFFMGEKVRIPVRLRYRMSNQKVVWFYNIYRPDLVITQQVEADLLTLTKQTELPSFAGKPEIS